LRTLQNVTYKNRRCTCWAKTAKSVLFSQTSW